MRTTHDATKAWRNCHAQLVYEDSTVWHECAAASRDVYVVGSSGGACAGSFLFLKDSAACDEASKMDLGLKLPPLCQKPGHVIMPVLILGHSVRWSSTSKTVR